MDYPKQETGTVRGTVSYRDLVTIREDDAPGGSGQPSYTKLLHSDLPAEVLQVSGGEVIRGKQVEARTSFVIIVRRADGVTPRCCVEITTGPYAGTTVYVGQVLHETARSRPLGVQLHCGTVV